MKKLILIFLISLMSFTSCVSGDFMFDNCTRIYFDRVVSGHIVSDDYVFDGVYSYHILSPVPVGVYWELCPCKWEIYIYTPDFVKLRLFDYTRRAIYFNRRQYRFVDFDRKHRPIKRPEPQFRFNSRNNQNQFNGRSNNYFGVRKVQNRGKLFNRQ